MHDTGENRFPRLAPILLIGAILYLALVRPGNLAEDAAIGYRLTTTLTAIAIIGYVSWQFHGILAAAAAIVLLRYADQMSIPSAAFVERQTDVALLATLAIGIAAAKRQGQKGKVEWLLIAIVAVCVAVFGWFGFDAPPSENPIARDRMRQIMILLAVSSLVVGLMAKSPSWLDRIRLLTVTILPPAASICAFKIIYGEWPRLLEGGNWHAVPAEWSEAIHDWRWGLGAWAWTVPPIVATLILIGIWRTIARGRQEWGSGQAPAAWLMTVATVGALAAVGARPLAPDSLVLAAAGALLTVFGIADQLLAIKERFELRPPESSSRSPSTK